MKIVSLDRSVEIVPPTSGMGFVISLDGHSWFYDPDGTLRISIPPDQPGQHVAAREIYMCPACKRFFAK